MFTGTKHMLENRCTEPVLPWHSITQLTGKLLAGRYVPPEIRGYMWHSKSKCTDVKTSSTGKHWYRPHTSGCCIVFCTPQQLTPCCNNSSSSTATAPHASESSKSQQTLKLFVHQRLPAVALLATYAFRQAYRAATQRMIKKSGKATVMACRGNRHNTHNRHSMWHS